MNIIYMLLAISIIVAIIFFIAFVLSVKKGQYDDIYTPSVRVLFDNEIVPAAEESQTEQQKTKNTRNLE